MEKERPKVGIGVIIKKGNQILIGERLDGHGKNTFMIAGGHLEFGESFEEAALREAKEETGLNNLHVIGIISVGNDVAYDKHYVSIGVLVEWQSGEPYNAEPTKAQNWYWGDPNKLPEPFFSPSKKVIQNWLEGKVYTD